MPTVSDFDAAMLQVGRSVPAVQRLGGGTIAMSGQRQPWRIVGRDAVIYQLNQPSGSALALRCPLGDVQALDPNQGERYRALATDPTVAALRRGGGPILSGIVYFQEGITLPAGDFRSRAHPLIAMEWVKGPTLLAAVDHACQNEDDAFLTALAEAWATMMNRLAGAEFSHGDLVADNVMLRPSGSLALVDYDTCSWPDAPGTRRSPSGTAVQAGIEALPPGYAHPSGAVAPLAQRDHYPALVIFTSLQILRRWPRLRQQFGDPPDTPGGVLLFTGSDLASPERSSLVRAIQGLDDPVVDRLLSILLQAGSDPIREVPPLSDVVAAVRMVSARSGIDRTQSRASWQPDRLSTRTEAWPTAPRPPEPDPTELIPGLAYESPEGPQPTRPRRAADWNEPVPLRDYRASRSDPADPLDRQRKLTQLNSLLLAGDEAAAERFWRESGLEADPEAVRELGTRIGDIHRRRMLNEARAAAEAGDSESFLRSWDEGRLDQYQPAASLRPLVESARRRSSGPDHLRAALDVNDVAAVVQLWPELRSDPRAAPYAVRVHALIQEHALAAIAAAMRRSDDEALDLAVREAEAVGVAVSQTARQAVRAARERIETRRALRAAVATNDRAELAAVALSGRLADLGPLEPSVNLAVKRAIAWPHLERALRADDDNEIRATYDPELFDDPTTLTPEQRARVDLARLRLSWLDHVRQAIRKRDSRALRAALGKPPPGAEAFLTAVERTRIVRLTTE